MDPRTLNSFRNSLMFMTPGLPFVPAIAVTVNIYLIFKLSILTLVRFTVWMILGKRNQFNRFTLECPLFGLYEISSQIIP